MHRFLDIRLWKVLWPWNPHYRLFKVIANRIWPHYSRK